MKLSTYIEKLQALAAKHGGDLEVLYPSEYGPFEAEDPIVRQGFRRQCKGYAVFRISKGSVRTADETPVMAVLLEHP